MYLFVILFVEILSYKRTLNHGREAYFGKRDPLKSSSFFKRIKQKKKKNWPDHKHLKNAPVKQDNWMDKNGHSARVVCFKYKKEKRESVPLFLVGVPALSITKNSFVDL